MKSALLATVATVLLGLAASAQAATVLTFGQVGNANTITATANGAGTATDITASDVLVSITQILGGVPTTADFNLDLASTSAVTPLGGGAALQHYDGSFSLTSGAGGTGTNYLSGMFTDLVLGDGSSAVLSASAPPDAVTFTSGIIADLSPPLAISLSFANALPAIAIDGTTLASFTSSVSGDFSATAAPEPGSLALLGVGLLGIAAFTRYRVRD